MWVTVLPSHFTSGIYLRLTREFEDPYLLAVNFCNKHGLNQKAVDIIERKIEDTLKSQRKIPNQRRDYEIR